MPRTFHGHGIVLAYPDNWEAEESETDDGWSLLLQSPGSAFVQLIGQTRGKGTDAMAACAAALADSVEALREDYPELETEPALETLAGEQALGEDIRFISFDLTATCWLRAAPLGGQTLLVLCQAADLELEQAEPTMRAIRSSIRSGEAPLPLG